VGCEWDETGKLYLGQCVRVSAYRDRSDLSEVERLFLVIALPI
jgi:hypothetical protein